MQSPAFRKCRRHACPAAPCKRKWNHWRKSACESARMRRRISSARSSASTSMAPESKCEEICSMGGGLVRWLRGAFSVFQAAAEHPAGRVRRRLVEGIAVLGEALELVRLGHAVRHRVARHGAAGPLGVERNDLVAAALPVLEYRRDDARLQHLGPHHLEILFRSKVDQHRRAFLLQLGHVGVEHLRDIVAPERVQVLAGGVVQPRAHFQPVGLHPVQRAQHAVQAGQDAQMLLREAEVFGRQRFGVEAVVDIAVEGQHRLLAVGRGKRWRPVGVARHVEHRELVRDVHQRAHVLRRQPAQALDQRGGTVDEARQRVGLDAGGSLVVQRLGGRQNDEHGKIAAVAKDKQAQIVANAPRHHRNQPARRHGRLPRRHHIRAARGAGLQYLGRPAGVPRPARRADPRRAGSRHHRPGDPRRLPRGTAPGAGLSAIRALRRRYRRGAGHRRPARQPGSGAAAGRLRRDPPAALQGHRRPEVRRAGPLCRRRLPGLEGQGRAQAAHAAAPQQRRGSDDAAGIRRLAGRAGRARRSALGPIRLRMAARGAALRGRTLTANRSHRIDTLPHVRRHHARSPDAAALAPARRRHHHLHRDVGARRREERGQPGPGLPGLRLRRQDRRCGGRRHARRP
ncbi:hypothetical protein CBM2587_A100007 [Cupriavidus taiwanensis]|uniref:Uncharacterized protein n=1 Tax=Cupriavidus taiwanensis TaxID=164546 RepID=A0A975WTE1_9BURK|nr:hypothetical protein CBM2587_A100007 [Cupriavidus taiwanensis]